MKHSHSYYKQIPYTKYFKRQKQPFADDFKVDTVTDFAIFTEKHLCWSLFLITLQVLRSTILLERGSITAKNIAKFLRTALKESLFLKMSYLTHFQKKGFF